MYMKGWPGETVTAGVTLALAESRRRTRRARVTSRGEKFNLGLRDDAANRELKNIVAPGAFHSS
jgi:hypothetical protein